MWITWPGKAFDPSRDEIMRAAQQKIMKEWMISSPDSRTTSNTRYLLML